MRQVIYALGQPINTNEYSSWLKKSDNFEGIPGNTVPDAIRDLILNSFLKGRIYFVKSKGLAQYLATNRSLAHQFDVNKPIGQSCCIFKIEIEDTQENTRFVVRKIIEAHIVDTRLPLLESTENRSVTCSFLEIIEPSFTVNKEIICDQSNFTGKFSELQAPKQMFNFLCSQHKNKIFPNEVVKEICSYVVGKAFQS